MLLYYLHHMLAIYILFVPDVQKINGVGSKLALGATSEWVIVHAINDHLSRHCWIYVSESLSFTSASFLNLWKSPFHFSYFRNECQSIFCLTMKGTEELKHNLLTLISVSISLQYELQA